MKEFEEVESLNLDPNTNNKVTIFRKDARPEVVYCCSVNSWVLINFEINYMYSEG